MQAAKKHTAVAVVSLALLAALALVGSAGGVSAGQERSRSADGAHERSGDLRNAHDDLARVGCVHGQRGGRLLLRLRRRGARPGLGDHLYGDRSPVRSEHRGLDRRLRLRAQQVAVGGGHRVDGRLRGHASADSTFGVPPGGDVGECGRARVGRLDGRRRRRRLRRLPQPALASVDPRSDRRPDRPRLRVDVRVSGRCRRRRRKSLRAPLGMGRDGRVQSRPAAATGRVDLLFRRVGAVHVHGHEGGSVRSERHVHGSARDLERGLLHQRASSATRFRA